jgi:hypothetical protein
MALPLQVRLDSTRLAFQMQCSWFLTAAALVGCYEANMVVFGIREGWCGVDPMSDDIP